MYLKTLAATRLLLSLTSGITTTCYSTLGKSVLQSIASEAKGESSWLEQKLKETKSYNSSSDKTGFVKIRKSGQPTINNVSASKDVTLTEKALKAKQKWMQSEDVQTRLRERAKDPSLAGWQRRKIELKLKHRDSKWEPSKRLSASSMEKIRLLNLEFPEEWTLKKLSGEFKVSQETIRRIIKSKFRPSEERIKEREQKRKAKISDYKKRNR